MEAQRQRQYAEEQQRQQYYAQVGRGGSCLMSFTTTHTLSP